MAPAAGELGFEVLGEPALRGEDRQHHPLGDRDVVHAGRVAESHPRRDVLDDVVDAGRERLDHAQAVDVPGVLERATGVFGRQEHVAPAGDFRDRAGGREEANVRDGGEPVALDRRRALGDPDGGSHGAMMAQSVGRAPRRTARWGTTATGPRTLPTTSSGW